MSGREVRRVGRPESQAAATRAPINETFALTFAQASPAKRKNMLAALKTQERTALAQLLAQMVNDPKRSMVDERGQSLPAMMEYSPNGTKVTLAIEALKTMAEVSPDITLDVMKNALNGKTQTEHVKVDYVKVLEYLANRKPGYKRQVIKTLDDYVSASVREKGGGPFPYSGADQAMRASCRLQGKPEPAWD